MSFADGALVVAAGVLAAACSGNLHHTFAEPGDSGGDVASDGNAPPRDAPNDMSLGEGASDTGNRDGGDAAVDIASPDVPTNDMRAPDQVVDVTSPDGSDVSFDVDAGDARAVDAADTMDMGTGDPTVPDAPVDNRWDSLDSGCTDPVACTPAAPRLLAPLSTGRVTSFQPILKWTAAAKAHHYDVDICDDAMCDSIRETIVTFGVSAQPTNLLPPRTMSHWRVSAINGPFRTSSLVWEFSTGASSATTANTSWLGAPDFNQDGRYDLALGAAGQTFVLIHQAGALPALPASGISGPTDFGASIAYAGDFDGDGFGDLVASGVSSFPAYLFRGNPGGIDSNAPVSVGSGGTANFRFSVAGIGDVDGDGYSDLALGMGGPNFTWYWTRGSATGGNGAMAVFDPCGDNSDPNGDSLIEGCPASGAGDVNGDGYSDVIVCSRAAKEARIYLGGQNGLVSTPTTTLTLPSGVSTFGDACVGAGDVNGDGYADVMVATSGVGSVFLYYGSSSGIQAGSGVKLLGSTSTSIAEQPYAIGPAGDVNQDGYGDVIIGAYNDNVVYVYHGSATGIVSPAATKMTSLPAGGAYAGGVGAVGDANGDGYDDIVVTSRPCVGADALLFGGSSAGISSTATPTQTWHPAVAATCIRNVAR